MKQIAQAAFLKPQLYSFGCGSPMSEREFPDEAWEVAGIAKFRSMGATTFADPGFCNQLVGHLGPEKINRLTRLLCRHRWTHVPKQIDRFGFWEEKHLSVEEIFAPAGDLPTKGVWELEKIIEDPAIAASPRFNHLSLDETVEFDLFVGIPRADRIVLVDGNHRAIHEARRIQAGFAESEHLRVVVPVT